MTSFLHKIVLLLKIAHNRFAKCVFFVLSDLFHIYLCYNNLNCRFKSVCTPRIPQVQNTTKQGNEVRAKCS